MFKIISNHTSNFCPGSQKLLSNPSPEPKIGVAYKKKCVGLPMVRFSINGQDMQFLVDSGSLVSIISVQMMTELRMSIDGESKMSLMSASGTPLRTKGFIDLKMETKKGVTITHRFLVLEGIATDAIIGADLLKKYGFKVDFQNRKLAFELENKVIEMRIHITRNKIPDEIMHIPPGESRQFFMECNDFHNCSQMTLADGISINMFTAVERNPVSVNSAVCVITNSN